MRKYGYLDASSTSTSEMLYHEEAITAAIKIMQKYGGLNETGIVDNATYKVRRYIVSACFLSRMNFLKHCSLYSC